MNLRSLFSFLLLFVLFLPLSSQIVDENPTDTIPENKPEIFVDSLAQGQDLVVSDTIITSTDTTIHQHSPRKAAIFSAVLPGLGQVYNKKWWKLPIIYGGFAFFGISAQQNNVLYQDFLAAYTHKMLADSTPAVNQYEVSYTKDQLLLAKKTYRRGRDYMIILGSLWYILNIVDASVDAHLFYWEVDDDLSFRIEPKIIRDAYARKNIGFSLKMRF